MIKAFVILALICSITSTTVSAKKEIQRFDFNSVLCLITSEQIIDSVKIIINLIKNGEWMRIFEYLVRYYPDIQIEVNKCLNPDTVLKGINVEYQQCLKKFPRNYCAKYLDD